MSYVLYARRELSAIAEQYRDLSGVIKAVDSLLTQGWNVTIEQQSVMSTDDKHPFIGQMVDVMSGKNQGVRGTVKYVRPSEFKPGSYYATIYDGAGNRVFADVEACRPVDTTQQQLAPKPAAPSVRKPMAQRLNGAAPW